MGLPRIHVRALQLETCNIIFMGPSLFMKKNIFPLNVHSCKSVLFISNLNMWPECKVLPIKSRQHVACEALWTYKNIK